MVQMSVTKGTIIKILIYARSWLVSYLNNRNELGYQIYFEN
jgi:hypothetical protein